MQEKQIPQPKNITTTTMSVTAQSPIKPLPPLPPHSNTLLTHAPITTYPVSPALTSLPFTSPHLTSPHCSPTQKPK